MSRDFGSDGLVAATLHSLGMIRYQENPSQLGAAEDLLGLALQALEKQLSRLGGSHDVRGRYRARFHEFYLDAIEVQLELDQPETAFHTLERSRARSFLEQLAERESVFTADIATELDQERRRFAVRFDRTQQQLAKLNDRDHAEKIEELLEELRRLRDEARDIEERIRRTSPKLAALQYPQPLDLEAAGAILDAGTLMLSYSVGKETTVLFTIAKGNGFRVETLPIPREQLREKVQAFDRNVRSASRPESQRMRRFEELARSLYTTLIEPVADRIEASERLLILADGPLHYIPWGALLRDLSGSSGQYLVEWKPFHLALSATVYAELRQHRPPLGEQAPADLVAAFGNPRYPGTRENAARHGDVGVRSAAERGRFNWSPLPHTRREVEAIASIYPVERVRVYLGEEATEEHAKSLGRDVGIVHFATHGEIDKRFPLNSYLALTIPEEYREGRDNGLLQAWEIFERIRLDADLVVLSACETALGEEQGGEGLVGLTRAFQYAGARSVAASLWSVADQTTAELMLRFYRHLRSGLPKDEALRAAQLEFIRGPIEVRDADGQEAQKDASAPYYWAAFQIYGDWQ